MTAISDRHRGGTPGIALLYLGVFAASTVVAVFNRFSEERLRLLWREWLTRILINGYLSGHTYYRLKAREEIDNPDQRITEDVKAYTQTTLSFFILSSTPPSRRWPSSASSGRSRRCWSSSPSSTRRSARRRRSSWAGRLVGLNNLQLKKEADLRYELIQVREAAETIATLGIEKAVARRLRGRLAEVVENTRAIIAREPEPRLLHQRLQLPDPARPAPDRGPACTCAGEVEFGVVTQSAMAFATVLGAFSLIVTQFDTLSTFAAVTERLNTIAGAIEQSRATARAGARDRGG